MNNTQGKTIRSTCLVFFVIVIIGKAGVNLKNGNYYVTFTDLTTQSEPQLEITRTYNSKSTHLGWFGLGWGSEYETRLETTAGGSVIIHENGSGAMTYFVPEKEHEEYAVVMQKSVAELVKLEAENPSTDVKDPCEYATRLLNDKELRQLKWQRALHQGDVNAVNIPIATRFVSGSQVVERTRGGYTRELNDGKKEHFNHLGQLIEIKLPFDRWIQFNYDKQDIHTTQKKTNVRTIKTSAGEILFLFWGDQGTLERIAVNKGIFSYYHYDEKANLIFSRNSTEESHGFKYDDMHNLTLITYPDGQEKKMVYEPNTLFISQITDRDGETKSYAYGQNG